MKLGSKAKTNDFVDALIAEGVNVQAEGTAAAAAASSHSQSRSSAGGSPSKPAVHTEG